MATLNTSRTPAWSPWVPHHGCWRGDRIPEERPVPHPGARTWTTSRWMGPGLSPAQGESMRLYCEFSAPVARTDLDDYVRPLEISVGCYDEDGLNEYTVGRLALDQILWAQAIVDGVSLFEVCDNDSQGLHEVHTALTGGRQDFRPDLRINEPTDHVLFLYGAVFHPSVRPCRQGILEAALTLFGELSLAVMWKDTSGLSEAELADLGFCKIAGSELIFRHSALRTPFSDRFPRGQDADVDARPEYEGWVEQEWQRFCSGS